jgi:hypothetical protein
LITYSKVYCQVIGPWAIYIAPSKLSSTKEIHGASHDERALAVEKQNRGFNPVDYAFPVRLIIVSICFQLNSVALVRNYSSQSN